MNVTPKTETLRGELVDFREIREHWGIAKIKVSGKGTITAPGKVLGAAIGDTVCVTGTWEDGKYGLQFKIQSCERMTPEGSAGMVKWIASRCPDVGDARARAMVARFGDKLWRVIEDDPQALCAVKGITVARAQAIATAYDRFRGERDQMIVLRDWQLTDNQISQCLTRWKSLGEVIAALRDNPYLLTEVAGFGFLKSDKIASAMGVAKDAPSRIHAGIMHVLAESRGVGHCFMAGRQLQAMSSRLLGVSEKDVGAALGKARDEGEILCEDWRVYTPRLHGAEVRVAEAVGALLSAKQEHAA